jgi:uncharacterized protein (TIGR02466 family)
MYSSHSGVHDFEKEISFSSTLDIRRTKENNVSVNTKILDYPEMQSCKSICEKHLQIYAENVFSCTQEFYITNSWITVSNPGDSHHNHNHPNSIISGILYLQTDDQTGKISFQHESALKKQFCFSYNIKKYNMFNSDRWSYTPMVGEVLLFPSWVNHQVEVNLSSRPRIILGFNSFVKGQFGDNDYSSTVAFGNTNTGSI